METQKMTVHKALCELKTIDSRIQKAIDSSPYVVVNKHSSKKINGVSIDEFCRQAKSAYQSVNDLINRRNAIKRAVVLSNATTKVSINGIEYTVAEAIEMKNHGIKHLDKLVRQLTQNYTYAQGIAKNKNGVELDTRADAYIKDLFGSSDMKNAAEEIKKARAEFMESQTFELVDPIGVQKEIERLNNEIVSFQTEVDSALSVSNAVTEIEFSY